MSPIFRTFAPFYGRIIMNTSLFYTHLYRWYEANSRSLPWRETQSPYSIWISEIILQQTRVAQGIDYYRRFMEQFPTVEALAQASEDEVLRLWQGLGYYSRARNLHRAAQQIGSTDRFPATYDSLRALAGVGDYTAAAIAAFAYNLPYAAIDGNICRVLARLFDMSDDPATAAGKNRFRQAADQLLDTRNPRLYNNAMMELGALQCTPRDTSCDACPVQNHCLAYAHHTVSLLPVHTPKKPLHDRYLAYYIYIKVTPQHETYTLLHRRDGNDIWRHLWEFPLVEQTEPFSDPLPSRGVQLTHILSHQRLHARFYLCPVCQMPTLPNTIEVPLDRLQQYAMPRLLLRAMEQIDFFVHKFAQTKKLPYLCAAFRKGRKSPAYISRSGKYFCLMV